MLSRMALNGKRAASAKESALLPWTALSLSARSIRSVRMRQVPIGLRLSAEEVLLSGHLRQLLFPAQLRRLKRLALLLFFRMRAVIVRLLRLRLVHGYYRLGSKTSFRLVNGRGPGP